MAKRYYWLKLSENFFEEDTIAWLEEQKNGKDYVIFYLKLCLKSLNDDGRLVRYVGEKLIPYDIPALSKLTNTPPDTVVVAMKLFIDIGLVTQFETGEIYMNQIDELIGSETDSAKRMRKKRILDSNNQPALNKASHCDNNVQKCDKDVQKCDIETRDKETRDKETRDKETRDKETRDKETENISSPAGSTPAPTPYQEIVDSYNRHCIHLPRVKTITDKRKKTLRTRWKKYNKLDTYEQVFIMAERSDFLSGRNGKWTGCNFDWLINENNMVKVIEGNYENKGKKSGLDILKELYNEDDDDDPSRN